MWNKFKQIFKVGEKILDYFVYVCYQFIFLIEHELPFYFKHMIPYYFKLLITKIVLFFKSFKTWVFTKSKKDEVFSEEKMDLFAKKLAQELANQIVSNPSNKNYNSKSFNNKNNIDIKIDESKVVLDIDTTNLEKKYEEIAFGLFVEQKVDERRPHHADRRHHDEILGFGGDGAGFQRIHQVRHAQSVGGPNERELDPACPQEGSGPKTQPCRRHFVVVAHAEPNALVVALRAYRWVADD